MLGKEIVRNGRWIFVEVAVSPSTPLKFDRTATLWDLSKTSSIKKKKKKILATPLYHCKNIWLLEDNFKSLDVYDLLDNEQLYNQE